jgi:hypothetical protein
MSFQRTNARSPSNAASRISTTVQVRRTRSKRAGISGSSAKYDSQEDSTVKVEQGVSGGGWEGGIRGEELRKASHG